MKIIAVCLVALLLLVSPVLAQGPTETEPNDTPKTANPVQYSITGVAAGEDVDYFSLSPQYGGVYQVFVHTVCTATVSVDGTTAQRAFH